MCAATADSPSAAITTGSTSGRNTRSSSRATAFAAMLPSPGAIPALVGNHTVRPLTVPIPCTPGT